MKRGIPAIAWTLAALLGVSAVFLSLGKRENVADPDSTSYGPSGLRALADLLRSEGFRVRTERRSRFVLRDDELAVAAIVRRGGFGFDPRSRDRAFEERLEAHLRSGGAAVVLAFDIEFDSASSHALRGGGRAEPAIVGIGRASLMDQPLSVSIGPGVLRSARFLGLRSLERDSTPLWRVNQGETLAELVRVERGPCLLINDALGATNRFLDREDNARLMLWAMSALAKPGETIVFLEAGHSPQGVPSALEILGPWAVAAWWQAIFVFVLLIVAGGLRFGLPEVARFREAGARDLVDAVGSLYSRGRATHLAFSALAAEADRALRQRLKLPSDAHVSMRNRMLPDDLAAALTDAETLAESRCPEGEAVAAARRLERLAADFLGRSATSGGRRKRPL